MCGSSCSVYGYSENKLLDEESPTGCNSPYGISKLMGETGILQLIDSSFSVIVFRQGTVSGFSYRMRLDLIINTMVGNALYINQITVNNPNVYRLILAIQDAVNAYLVAIKTSYDVSGVFNIASVNSSVGEIAEQVVDCIKSVLGFNVPVVLKNIDEQRSYQVTWEKASNILGFSPRNDIKDIVLELIENKEYFSNFNNPIFHNVAMFKKLNLSGLKP